MKNLSSFPEQSTPLSGAEQFDCVKVKRVSLRLMQVLIGWNYFYEEEFQNKLSTQTSATCCVKQHYFNGLLSGLR